MGPHPIFASMKEIFIVEDDPDIRELIEYLLVSLEFKVESFPTAEDFYNGISGHSPDLILLDIMLPDGNGLEICKMLKDQQQTNQIPVLLMSAHADGNLLRGHCANDFISKPFDIDDLVNRIQQYV